MLVHAAERVQHSESFVLDVQEVDAEFLEERGFVGVAGGGEGGEPAGWEGFGAVDGEGGVGGGVVGLWVTHLAHAAEAAVGGGRGGGVGVCALEEVEVLLRGGAVGLLGGEELCHVWWRRGGGRRGWCCLLGELGVGGKVR